MPNIFTTAKYILKKPKKKNPHKLQLLCYYSQGWALACNDEELFPEDFEAWVSGPTCNELFDFYKSEKLSPVGYESIPDERCDGELTEEQCKVIDAVLKVYGPLNEYQLEKTVHTEEPYKKARTGLKSWEYSKNVISKEDMKAFFKSMRKEENLPTGAEITD